MYLKFVLLFIFLKSVLVLYVFFFKVFFFNNKEEKMFEKGYILDV